MCPVIWLATGRGSKPDSWKQYLCAKRFVESFRRTGSSLCCRMISVHTCFRNRKVLNRLEINGESNSFITLKDHKENFNNNPTVRLINPAKNELGHISKAILDTANKNIREAMGLNQWRNTDTVIDWFKSIRNKHLCKFIIFDIREFYPSITENLLKKALTFAEAHTHFFQMMTKQLFTAQENHYSLPISKVGLRVTVSYSM